MDLSSASPLASYALAKVESFLEGLAEVQSISPAQLIGEVGQLLTNGTGTRAKVETSHSRAGQAEDEAEEGIKPASLAKRAYRARVRKGGQGGQGSWAAWPTPELRAKEMARRQAVAQGRAKPRPRYGPGSIQGRGKVAKFPLGGVA